MAQAIVKHFVDKYNNGDGTYRWEFDIAYFGADVSPTIEDSASVSITVDTTVTLAQIGTLLAAAIRANATSKGLTIPANKVFLPSFQQA